MQATHPMRSWNNQNSNYAIQICQLVNSKFSIYFSVLPIDKSELRN